MKADRHLTRRFSKQQIGEAFALSIDGMVTEDLLGTTQIAAVLSDHEAPVSWTYDFAAAQVQGIDGGLRDEKERTITDQAPLVSLDGGTNVRVKEDQLADAVIEILGAARIGAEHAVAAIGQDLMDEHAAQALGLVIQHELAAKHVALAAITDEDQI